MIESTITVTGEAVRELLAALATKVEVARRKGYDEGYEDGYDEGYEHGEATGFDGGYNEGVGDGYDEGYEDGCADERSVISDAAQRAAEEAFDDQPRIHSWPEGSAHD